MTRRSSDRQLDLPGVFTLEETARIREMLSRSSREIDCPRCRSPMSVNEPFDAAHPFWDVFCETCNRSATITATDTRAILLSAEDAMTRETLSFVLTKAGHRVYEAETGSETMRLYQSKVPDLVIVDASLSDMDGIDLMRRLLRFDNQACVIIMAGPRRHGAPDPLAMAKRLGATRVLRKPFPPHEMLTAVSEVLRS